MAESSFRELKDKLARYPSALGIGEVGIDHTSGCACGRCDYGVTCRRRVDAQTEFLELVFQHVKQHDTTLVIHVRDWGTGLAASEVLALLKKYGLQNARIHRHCFIGSAEEYKEWKKEIPNCYFSISSKSLDDIEATAWPLLQRNLDRLVVETDSRYLKDQSPLGVINSAKGVAEKIQMPVNDLVRVCNKNVVRLYNLF